tara:strand:- start:68 stop:211 length:144 start_codon:yes stop_codon:yes gene_type:complete
VASSFVIVNDVWLVLLSEDKHHASLVVDSVQSMGDQENDATNIQWRS